jgi:hypothetical protein
LPLSVIRPEVQNKIIEEMSKHYVLSLDIPRAGSISMDDLDNVFEQELKKDQFTENKECIVSFVKNFNMYKLLKERERSVSVFSAESQTPPPELDVGQGENPQLFSPVEEQQLLSQKKPHAAPAATAKSTKHVMPPSSLKMEKEVAGKTSAPKLKSKPKPKPDPKPKPKPKPKPAKVPDKDEEARYKGTEAPDDAFEVTISRSFYNDYLSVNGDILETGDSSYPDAYVAEKDGGTSFSTTVIVNAAGAESIADYADSSPDVAGSASSSQKIRKALADSLPKPEPKPKPKPRLKKVDGPWTLGEPIRDVGGRSQVWLTSDEKFIVKKIRGKANYFVAEVRPNSENEIIFQRGGNTLFSSKKLTDVEAWIRSRYEDNPLPDAKPDTVEGAKKVQKLAPPRKLKASDLESPGDNTIRTVEWWQREKKRYETLTTTGAAEVAEARKNGETEFADALEANLKIAKSHIERIAKYLEGASK